jgi:glycosyltransferase involved in cell wall biosynthesis
LKERVDSCNGIRENSDQAEIGILTNSATLDGLLQTPKPTRRLAVIKILHVVDNLGANGSATQLHLQVRGLPRARFDARVCVLGKDVPGAAAARWAGVPLEVLGWQRPLDFRAAAALRQLVRRFQPDLIHAGSPVALRSVSVTLDQFRGAVLVSAPFDPTGQFAALDRVLMQRVDCSLARGQTEARWLTRLGYPAHAIQILQPAVEDLAPDSSRSAASGGSRMAPRILCAGRLEPHNGFVDAIWVFDILRRAHGPMQLVLLGEGSERPKLENFARELGSTSCIEFAGRRSDITAALADADMVWVPSRVHYCGLNVALEAMAAGRPVIATRRAGLDEVVADGVTGYLVPPGDKIALAKQTSRLISDPALRERLGTAGRQRAMECFSAHEMVQQLAEIYEQLVAGAAECSRARR